MSRFRKSAVLAVVALGLVALAAPAASPAKSSSIERLNKDVDRLGKNVNDLRKKTDDMNHTIASLASTAGNALTQLQGGLTTLANTTANFKYAVVQVATDGGGKDGIAGVGATHFFATPPMYKTGEQSTVTFTVPNLTAAGSTNLALWTAVRSANPDSGKVSCRITVQGGWKTGGATMPNSTWATLRNGTSDGAFVTLPQSRLVPENGNKNFPTQLVPTEDNAVDMASPDYTINLGNYLGNVRTQQRPTDTEGAVVTLSCITT